MSITPVSASSKLRIRLDLGAIGAQSGGTKISLRAGFFEGSTCVGFATQNFSTTSGGIGQMFLEKEVPNSDRKRVVEGKSVSESGELGGRRDRKKKKTNISSTT